jgi:hypothetical protein
MHACLPSIFWQDDERRFVGLNLKYTPNVPDQTVAIMQLGMRPCVPLC